MEAIIIGIAVDIGLGLLFLIGKKLFLSIRDYYRHSNGIFLKNSTEKDTPTVDKKEIDDEVQKAVENLVPSLAERISKRVGNDYAREKLFDRVWNGNSKSNETYTPPRWEAERRLEGVCGISCEPGLTLQDISASTPNSSKAPMEFETFIRNMAETSTSSKDKKVCEAIIDGYKTAMDDKPKKVADAFQAHLDYVKDVIKCMEEWGEMPVPSHIRTKMVNAESVDDLLDAEDEYHKMVSAHFRGQKYKSLLEMHNNITRVGKAHNQPTRVERDKRDEQPFMLTDSYGGGGGGEIDREILASSAFEPDPIMFDFPQW